MSTERWEQTKAEALLPKYVVKPNIAIFSTFFSLLQLWKQLLLLSISPTRASSLISALLQVGLALFILGEREAFQTIDSLFVSGPYWRSRILLYLTIISSIISSQVLLQAISWSSYVSITGHPKNSWCLCSQQHFDTSLWVTTCHPQSGKFRFMPLSL